MMAAAQRGRNIRAKGRQTWPKRLKGRFE